MYSVFSVSVILTLNGLINWITVISTIYSYINMMLSEGPQVWIFKELQLLAKIHYGIVYLCYDIIRNELIDIDNKNI